MLSRLMTRREQALLFGFVVAVLVGSAALYWHRSEARIPDRSTPVVLDPPRPAIEAADAPEPVPAADEAAAPRGEAATLPTADEKEHIAVAAMGAVRRAGLYYFPPEARVADLLEVAGGVSEVADLSDINFSAHLIDGTTLTVPIRPMVYREGNTVSYRRVHSGAELNPPQYLRSGWQAQQRSPIAPATGEAAGTAPEAASGPALVNLNTATAQEIESLPGIGPVLASRIIEYRAQNPFTTVDDLQFVSGIGPKRMEAIRPFVTVN